MILKLLCTITNNTLLIEHFLKHYYKQGVTHFYFLHYKSADEIIIPERFKKYTTVLRTDFKEGIKETDYNILNPNLILQKRFVKKNEWYIIADLDELHTLRNKHLKLIDAIKLAEDYKYNYLRGVFIDRVARNNIIPTFLEKNIWRQFPYKKHITRDIAKGCVQKCVAAKGNITLGPGHHNADEKSKKHIKILPHTIEVHHFKWWGDILVRLHKRYYERTVLYKSSYTKELLRMCEYFNYPQLQQMINGEPPTVYGNCKLLP